LLDVVSILVPAVFALLVVAVLTWLVVIWRQIPEQMPTLYTWIRKITRPLFSIAPIQPEIANSDLPTKLVVGRLIPLIFWILIFLPMILFPIILIIMPLLGIPWSYLLPPVP
jgi:hypothetical protein